MCVLHMRCFTAKKLLGTLLTHLSSLGVTSNHRGQILLFLFTHVQSEIRKMSICIKSQNPNLAGKLAQWVKCCVQAQGPEPGSTAPGKSQRHWDICNSGTRGQRQGDPKGLPGSSLALVSSRFTETLPPLHTQTHRGTDTHTLFKIQFTVNAEINFTGANDICIFGWKNKWKKKTQP